MGRPRPGLRALCRPPATQQEVCTGHEARGPAPLLGLAQRPWGPEAVGCGQALAEGAGAVPPTYPWRPQRHLPSQHSPSLTPSEPLSCRPPVGGRHQPGTLRAGHGSPSRRAPPPGLRSGLPPGSQSLFLFAQRSPSPPGSSQRHCAGGTKPHALEMRDRATQQPAISARRAAFPCKMWHGADAEGPLRSSFERTSVSAPREVQHVLGSLRTHCDLSSQQQRAVGGSLALGPHGGEGGRREEPGLRQVRACAAAARGVAGGGQRAVLPAVPCGDHRSQPPGRGTLWDMLARFSRPPPLTWAPGGSRRGRGRWLGVAAHLPPGRRTNVQPSSAGGPGSSGTAVVRTEGESRSQPPSGHPRPRARSRSLL